MSSQAYFHDGLDHEHALPFLKMFCPTREEAMHTGKNKIRLTGSSMTFYKPYRRATTDKKARVLSKGELLGRRRDRTICALIRAFCSIKSNHQWFISLSFPNWIVGDDDYANGKARLLSKFFDKLRYKLRKKGIEFRFLRKVEWAPKSGLHFHLTGSFSAKFERKKLTKLIRNLWAKVLKLSNKETIKLAAKVRDYNKLHDSYVTRRRKRKNEMRCLDLIGNCPMFTFVNKKHFRFYPNQCFELSDRQLKNLFTLIVEYLRSVGKNADSYIKQMGRTVGMMSFIPHGELVAMINTVLEA